MKYSGLKYIHGAASCAALFSEMVNVMNLKPLLPLLLAAAALSGCASTANDPAHAHALAEVQQARADGSLPLTEEQFVFPHLTAAHKAP